MLSMTGIFESTITTAFHLDMLIGIPNLVKLDTIGIQYRQTFRVAIVNLCAHSVNPTMR
jgi:hypothetical protein